MPHFIYRFNLIKERHFVLKRKSCINPNHYTVKQLWCVSKDNVKIPLFIVHKKEIKLNGENPLLLYGYGGFGISIVPHFNKNILPFLESGGIYAIANIRGGGEFGEKWHKGGVGRKKQKVFNDFISSAEWLIKNRYTNSNKLGPLDGQTADFLLAQRSHRDQIYLKLR